MDLLVFLEEPGYGEALGTSPQASALPSVALSAPLLSRQSSPGMQDVFFPPPSHLF